MPLGYFIKLPDITKIKFYHSNTVWFSLVAIGIINRESNKFFKKV